VVETTGESTVSAAGAQVLTVDMIIDSTTGESTVSAAGAQVLTVDMIIDSATDCTHKWYRQEDDRECSAATLITECNMSLTVSSVQNTMSTHLQVSIGTAIRSSDVSSCSPVPGRTTRSPLCT